MSHFLHEYPTEILLSIISKMDRTAFLRLSRSCKWIHNLIEENKRHITNCVTDDKISITIQKPELRRQFLYWNAPQYGIGNAPQPDVDVDLPLFYKLTVGDVDTGEFLTYEVFCQKMVNFHELRLAELEIFSKEMDDTVKLVEYLYSQQISCEKLTIFFAQDVEYIPDELTDLLRPLKLVVLPTQLEDDVLWSYNYYAKDVQHLSLVEVLKQDVQYTLTDRDILNKTSLFVHYIHNFRQEDDPFEYEGFYSDLLCFYKRFMSSDGNLKDFQCYFQNYRDHKYDPVLGDQEPDRLLTYIMGRQQPQTQSATGSETYAAYQEPPTLHIKDPSNPSGPPLEAVFGNSDMPQRWKDDRKPYSHGNEYNHQGGNSKKSLLAKTWLTSTVELHLNRLVVSITEGRKLKEYIMTLFAGSTEKMRVYFAIAVLTDWDSYTRFLGLMDTKNYEFPMEEIEEDVKKILLI